VIDSHAHLDACDPPGAELVAAAEEAGVTRIVTVGTDGASCRAALAAAEAFPQVYAAIGRHPHSAGGFDDADLAELRALAAHERCVAIGETGLDYYRDLAPRPDQARAFAAQIALAGAAARVPAERLLVETDAPYLSPQPVRGRPNEPANVVHTARFVAERRGVSYKQLEATVEANAAEVFGW